jgi:acyl-CoA thioesterase
MPSITDLISSYELVDKGDGRFSADPGHVGRGIIPGGQIVGLMIMAAARLDPGKDVKSLHAVFSRTVRADEPVELVLSGTRTGRLFSNADVDLVQGGKTCSQGVVLLHQPERDLITFDAPARSAGGPQDAPEAASLVDEGLEVRSVDGVDFMDRADRGDPRVGLWVRMPGVSDPVASAAAAAFLTGVWLIPTALRPHPWAMADTHVEISTGPVSHTMWFHEPFSADGWLLFETDSPKAGRGRTFGTGNIFREDGTLVASFAQENMIRHFPEGQSPEGREHTIL